MPHTRGRSDRTTHRGSPLKTRSVISRFFFCRLLEQRERWKIETRQREAKKRKRKESGSFHGRMDPQNTLGRLMTSVKATGLFRIADRLLAIGLGFHYSWMLNRIRFCGRHSIFDAWK